MAAQANTDARIIRENLNDLGAWIGIWKDDAAHGLPCTQSSLILAQSHVDNALAVLDRMQADQRAAA
ncbi:hypothetical protein EDC40_103689 [Aminobacter aminovorans]|uniref:Uncharacterized protein n=1 Tax=Aminobacter aminovorans TaxID=83263 RepID=A0A380WK29_AMIAI|nr:hypothetical protein [Aminobacter aminovorans]TCS28220.1 hypothetical protein EDC40_103689 [Aminobacter aminovorans]SUU89369.1 Uncharacterised protein [Aminobacter aminovorans]